MDDLEQKPDVKTEAKEQQPSLPWVSTEYRRAPWIRPGLVLGQTVLPPNEQASNLNLADDQVFYKRDEPIGQSVAFPINGGTSEMPADDAGQVAG